MGNVKPRHERLAEIRDAYERGVEEDVETLYAHIGFLLESLDALKEMLEETESDLQRELDKAREIRGFLRDRL